MGTVDPYGRTDRLDETSLEAIVTRLEARGKHPFFQKMLREYLDAMEIDAADTVLDLGCGTGVAARAIAGRPDFAGTVLGIDIAPFLVETADRLTREEGLAEKVSFRIGDTHSLDLGDGEFDAVVAHTLLSHVSDPLGTLKEARRVLKRGGRIGIFDGDYASMTFGHEDPEKGRAHDEALVAAMITQPRVMRRMPRMLREAGLELVGSFPYVLAEVGQADFWAPAMKSFRMLLPKAGAMSEADANTWVDYLEKASDDGVFFGASNFYSYVARRP